ncbi:MAG: hypothetical protein WAT81_01005 [Candidatus Moraniibacteriota bacterium]
MLTRSHSRSLSGILFLLLLAVIGRQLLERTDTSNPNQTIMYFGCELVDHSGISADPQSFEALAQNPTATLACQ